MPASNTPQRSKRPWVLGVLALLALGAVGSARLARPPTPEPPSSEPPAPLDSGTVQAALAPSAALAPEPKRPYNVLFLMIDSLRADMPWAGYPRQIAPWLTKFAKRSVLYPRAYSMSSYTAKSVAPTLVGKYPSEMKRDGWFFTHWFADNVFLGERAQKHGIRTLAGHAHGYFLPPYGMNQGFDDYRWVEGTAIDFTGVANVTSDRLNALAKKMLSDPANVGPKAKKPFFAYFHFLDPHFKYIKHDGEPDFGNERRDLYDNEVHFTDHWVGDLVDWCLEQPWGDDLAVIITADHGEGFGEHDHYRHAYELWEALVRVPLFVYVPGAAPRRIETPRGAIDLAPTMADLLGMPLGDTYRGKSLIPEVFGADPEPRPIVIDLPRSDLMDRRRALVDGDMKLIAFGDDWRYQLYDVAKDFEEKNELSGSEAEELTRMKALYARVGGSIVTRPVVGKAPLNGAPPGQRY